MELKREQLSAASRLRIVVLGYIVRGPLGGLVWHHLQYVLGLHLLGHEVLFLEDSDDYPACYWPETYEMSTDPTYGLQFLQQVFSRYGLANHWAYFDAHRQCWHGKTGQEVQSFLQDADGMLNLSGVNVLREPALLDIPHRALIDTDPAFTQIRHLKEEAAYTLAAQHNAFFTFGENYGQPDCLIPEDGFPWWPTRQPVVLELWPLKPALTNRAWTSVMQWDSYRVQEWQGQVFGMKSASFQAYENLPQYSQEQFQLAMGSASAPRDQLSTMGWQILDPLGVSRTPDDYQTFIQNSKGEWSIAKAGYVLSQSAWFSERSAGYLASGRPVIVQDTGFSKFLDTGMGVLAFNNIEEALTALDEVNVAYDQHCRAAREIAANYFEASKVLNQLLEMIF